MKLKYFRTEEDSVQFNKLLFLLPIGQHAKTIETHLEEIDNQQKNLNSSEDKSIWQISML